MSIFAMLGMDGQSLIVYHYISMLCIVVEKYFGIIKENSLIINLSNFLHRKVRNEINGNHLAFLDFQGRLFLLQNGGNVKIRLKNGRIM